MSKHTPGPWVVKSTIIGSSSSVKAIGRKDRDLSDQEMVCLVPQTNEEQVANTLLIQAAPDLLEALKGLVYLAHEAGFPCDKAEAAIAKAKGEVDG